MGVLKEFYTIREVASVAGVTVQQVYSRLEKAEKERAELAESNITDALNDEISRANAKETEIENQLVDTSKSPFTMSVASGKNQTSVTLPSKDNLDEHSIKIMLDCNFGEI